MTLNSISELEGDTNIYTLNEYHLLSVIND